MSSQRGNVGRTRCQKHRNKTAFVNDLHDTSLRTKMMNKLDVGGVCLTCKGVIEWKIKYKKYKPLTVPKKCTRCDNKSIQFAYHTICHSCAKKDRVCAKCGKSNVEIVIAKPTADEVSKLSKEYEQNLKLLTERQRRTLKRNTNDGPPNFENLQSLQAHDSDSNTSVQESEESESDSS